MIEVQIPACHNYYDLIKWFEDNVGKVLNFAPVVEAKGQGWSLTIDRKVEDTVDDLNNRFSTVVSVWTAKIDDELLATHFAMRWA